MAAIAGLLIHIYKGLVLQNSGRIRGVVAGEADRIYIEATGGTAMVLLYTTVPFFFKFMLGRLMAHFEDSPGTASRRPAGSPCRRCRRSRLSPSPRCGHRTAPFVCSRPFSYRGRSAPPCGSGRPGGCKKTYTAYEGPSLANQNSRK